MKKDTDEQISVDSEKKRIQKEFSTKLGLVVDRPSSGGSGNSNDGNTSRKAFHNPDVTARILGVDKRLVENFATILGTMSSGLHINTIAFKELCLDTAHLFVDLYPWYYMPQSVHRVLIHGYLVLEALSLPIGMMSEDAQESRNKDFRQYREHFTRKISREQNNEDLFHRLLITSDPFISSLRKPKLRSRIPLGASILKLLITPSGDPTSSKDEYDDNQYL